MEQFFLYLFVCFVHVFVFALVSWYRISQKFIISYCDGRPRPRPPRNPPRPVGMPRPRIDFVMAGGLFGRSASMRSVHPVVGFSAKNDAYNSLLKFELVSSCPTVNQPGRILESRPNKCNRRRPKQKCSIIWKISMGFSELPNSPSSDMIKSMSTFAWMKSPSVERRTVPLMPIRQCSFVRWNTAFGSSIFEWPGLLMFVRIQQISSHRRKPHLRKQLRPMSRPSELPHHKNTKLRLAAISLISSAWISSQFQNTRCCVPAAPKALPPRKYSYEWFERKISVF